MKFCSECGSGNLARSVPEGDHRIRYVCPDCGTVHYKNPLIVCGVVPVFEDRILLCKRGIEPRFGKWTLPAGFMELEESVEEGAQRELYEEAVATVELGPLLSVISVPRIGQVHMMYLGDLAEPKFATTPESTEVCLFQESEIPWEELAFRTVSTTLKHYFECRRSGDFSLLRDSLQ
ncbi:MAG: NUDIX hydrolase [Burkholderiales bacterium]|nr:MAG: NUDIX hydrolase [Burkholderiales bacterium]